MNKPMTVGELIVELNKFDKSTPVIVTDDISSIYSIESIVPMALKKDPENLCYETSEEMCANDQMCVQLNTEDLYDD